MQKQVSKQSLAVLALSILLAISMALTATFAAFTATNTATGTITFTPTNLQVELTGWGASKTLTLDNTAFNIDAATDKVTLKDTALNQIKALKVQVLNVPEGMTVSVEVEATLGDTLATLTLNDAVEQVTGSMAEAIDVFSNVQAKEVTLEDNATPVSQSISITVTATVVAA